MCITQLTLSIANFKWKKNINKFGGKHFESLRAIPCSVLLALNIAYSVAVVLRFEIYTQNTHWFRFDGNKSLSFASQNFKLNFRQCENSTWMLSNELYSLWSWGIESKLKLWIVSNVFSLRVETESNQFHHIVQWTPKCICAIWFEYFECSHIWLHP